MTLQQDINKLKPYFLSKDGGIMSGEVTPDITDTHNLGRSDKRWDTIYCREIVAEVGGGGGEGGDADTVDGYDAAGNPLPSNLLALDPQSTFPISVYPQALIKDGSRALEGNMAVVSGATIDGVDISEHTHTGIGGQGEAIAHADLTGLDADDHPQYTQRAQDEIVTGDWMFTHLQDRSAGWLFLPDDKIFKAVPHNMIFAADINKASISLGVLASSEYAIHIYDDDTPTTYIKVGRGDASITLHGTDPTYKLWAGDAVAADAPFHVKNDGAILAQSGVIAGWDIDTTTISKNNMSLNSVGRIIAGTGNELIQIDAADSTWRIWVGHATAASAPFRVNKLGQMYMYDAFVTGTLKSTNFISGQSGFSLDSSGLAEFQQIIARGRLEATVFAEAAISVASGKMIISDGAVLSVDIENTDDHITVDTDVFQQNDIVRVKPDAIRDEWMRITSPYTIVADGFKYYVARGLNDTEPTWAGPYDFDAGESVVRLGSAQQTNIGYPLSAGEVGGEYGEFQTGGSGATTGGGYLILEGSRNFGPFFGVSARYGPVYDQIVDVVRIGNLNGIFTYTEEEWGVFFGDANQYFSYDQTDGVRIEFSGTDVDSSIDKYGMKSEVLRIARTSAAPDYAVDEAKIWYEKIGSDLVLKARLRDDVATESEFTITGVGIKSKKSVEDPDNSRVIFSVGEAYSPGSMAVWVGGIGQLTGTDFTESSPSAGQFTMTTAPTTGTKITVVYGVNTATSSVQVAAWTLLSDTPASFGGHGGKVVRVNSGGDALEFGPTFDAYGALAENETVSGAWTFSDDVTLGSGNLIFDDAVATLIHSKNGGSDAPLNIRGSQLSFLGNAGQVLVDLTTTAFTFNVAKADVDFIFHGDTVDNLLFVDGGAGIVNVEYGAIHNYLDFEDKIAPGTPSSGYGRVYVAGDNIYFKDDGGVASSMISAGGAGDVTVGRLWMNV